MTTNEPRGAVHVWDLRAIRKHLAKMGLDWDAPAYSEDDPAAPTAPPFLRIEIDPLEDQFSEGAALAHRGRWEEAAAAYARGFAVRAPDNAPRWFEQALLRLAVDDAAGYRSTCRHMLDVLGSRNELEWLEFRQRTRASWPRTVRPNGRRRCNSPRDAPCAAAGHVV